MLLLAFLAPRAEAASFGYNDGASFVLQRQLDLKSSKSGIEKITIQLQLAIADFISKTYEYRHKSKKNPEMKKQPSGRNRFYFSEIDTSNILYEINRSDSDHADYFAKIYYTEIFYVGFSKSTDPKDCQFEQVVSRQITELARYHKGKWHY